MKIETKLLWAVLLTGVIVPLTAPAQSATLLTNIFNPAAQKESAHGKSVPGPR